MNEEQRAEERAERDAEIARDAANIILDLMQGAPVSIAYNIIGNITVSVFTAGRSSNPAPPWRSSIIRRRTRAR
ncbi:hypothetical protein ABIF65_005930 [Bradyrhizobium japonicum]|jgi:hypothetical protein|uniref:Uncharacterized protein n=1 Tax=Bradyrhizobium barranii subsp. barranii TaxID=2823807 RepID=A0A939MIQ4_9BRAD|nr:MULTISPECIES: hypothetical protein [Bradyrhizobium]MBR0883558.1 hypothetical protein [Bradyrhizobium liaoningense]MBR1003738.1 hypothetical protein [Bradyrhizobium liaoningense]MBR1033019.1 hypothetical protein [Bradyrhizobium liaoningense]MBR1069987.1 hypothetical protein [Bradyrhizobium liaoningense]MCP1744268.1 hypothetical protein [Bradyrhizobium japonicum]